MKGGYYYRSGAGTVVLETKATSEIKPEDVEQCLLYLHQGSYKVCLMVNFGVQPLKSRRFVLTPEKGKKDGNEYD